MTHPPWLIPPPSGGSFGCFTSPWRGSAETAFRLDSESQEDREGPQLTSSDWSVGETMFPLRAPTWGSTAELELVPGGDGRELEQRAVADRIAIPEICTLLVPGNLEQAFLDAMVEPRAAEHELFQPVHERLAADERDPFPVADEIAPESAARFVDPVTLDELDQVGGLVPVELVVPDESELDGGRGDALLEVRGVEAEAVPQELDHVVVAGNVVGLCHELRIAL